MCALGQQGALLRYPGPYGRTDGGFLPIYTTCSSFFPEEIRSVEILYPSIPCTQKFSYKEQNARCIVPDWWKSENPADIYIPVSFKSPSRGFSVEGGVVVLVIMYRKWMKESAARKDWKTSPQVVNRRAKILQAKPSGHHGNPMLVKALGSKEAWGVFRRHECRVTVIYCTQTHHKFKNLRSSSSSSTIIKCVFVSEAIKAELRHHFLPHAAATFSAFNCPQLSRSHTDL